MKGALTVTGMNADQMREFVELCKHPAIAGKREGWMVGDLLYNKSTDTILIYGNAGNAREQSIFIKMQDLKNCNTWLPPVCDYQHPERGLWGMVDWLNWELETLFSVEIAPVVIDTRQVSNIPLPEAMPLPIALAKAIIWQHERTNP